MERLRLAFLGSPEIYLDNKQMQTFSFVTLAFLAYEISEKKNQSLEEFADLLWPELSSVQIEENFSKISTEIRGILPADIHNSLLRRFQDQQKSLYLNRNCAYTADLNDFAALLPILSNQQPELSASLLDYDPQYFCNELEKIVNLYRGDFLEGLTVERAPGFTLWLEKNRELWRSRLQQAYHLLSILYQRNNKLDKAIATTKRWLNLQPSNEAAQFQLRNLVYSIDKDKTIISNIQGNPEAKNQLKSSERVEIELTHSGILASDKLNLEQCSPSILGDLVAKTFSGRESELKQLKQLFEISSRGSTQVAIVTAKRGEGKSRLLKEFHDWVITKGALIISGVAERSNTSDPAPYQLISSLLRDLLTNQIRPAGLLPGEDLGELSRLIPELRELYPHLPSATAQGFRVPLRLRSVVGNLIKTLAEQTAIVILLDDLQYTDWASSKLLEEVLPYWLNKKVPVLVICASDAQLMTESNPGLKWLSSIKKNLSVTTLKLNPLTEDETGQLLLSLNPQSGRKAFSEQGTSTEIPGDKSAESSFVQWFTQQTQGCPLQQIEFLKLLMIEKILKFRSCSEYGWVLDFPSIKNMKAKKVILSYNLEKGLRQIYQVHLTTEAKTFLEAAVILENQLSFSRIWKVSGLEEVVAREAIVEILNYGLLQNKPAVNYVKQAQTYIFPHEVLREIIYRDIEKAKCRILHKRALDLLRGVSVSGAELAYQAKGAELAEHEFFYRLAAGKSALELFDLNAARIHYERANILANRNLKQRVAVTDLLYLREQLKQIEKFESEASKQPEKEEAKREMSTYFGNIETAFNEFGNFFHSSNVV